MPLARETRKQPRVCDNDALTFDVNVYFWTDNRELIELTFDRVKFNNNKNEYIFCSSLVCARTRRHFMTDKSGRLSKIHRVHILHEGNREQALTP